MLFCKNDTAKYRLVVCLPADSSSFHQVAFGKAIISFFRADALRVYGDQLSAFNQAVSGTIKFML